MTQDKGERIAKRIARAGICSRRDAERLIEDNKVSVNGKMISSPALNVTEADHIKVRGKSLPRAETTKLFLYHKPAGLVTSHRDEKGRETMFDRLRADFPDELPRVVSVGRLDISSEGLLLLTNDGDLSRYLELPATGWSRQYRVRVHGRVNEKKLEGLKNGITVEGVRYKSIKASIENRPVTKEGEAEASKPGTNTWLSVTLKEGKNREIRRVMGALDLDVSRLIRVGYGPFALSKLPVGQIKPIEDELMKQQIAGYFKDK